MSSRQTSDFTDTEFVMNTDISLIEGYQNSEDEDINIPSSDEEDLANSRRVHERLQLQDHYIPDESTEYHESAESEMQLKDGILVIKKLDRHLKRLLKLENEARQSRRKFEAGMAKELEQLTSEFPSSANNWPSVLANTERFLGMDILSDKKKKKRQQTKSLVYLDKDVASDLSEPSTSESETEHSDQDSEVVPIFTTEIKSTSKTSNSHSKTRALSSSSSSDTATTTTHLKDNVTDPKATIYTATPKRADQKQAFVDQVEASSAKKKSSGRKTQKKDFLARNIELANDAKSNVPMTEEEKNRLAQLLADINEDNEDSDVLDQASVATDPGNALVVKEEQAVVETLHATPSDGYQLNDDEIERLSSIDNQLVALSSRSELTGNLSSRTTDVASILSKSTSSKRSSLIPLVRSSPASASVDLGSYDNRLSLIMEEETVTDSLVNLGEKALAEVRQTREVRTRLGVIDEKLAEITSSHPYPVEVDLPKLNDEEVKSLVKSCTSAMSNNTDDTSSCYTYDETLTSAVKLPDETLETLLNQAKQELGLISLDGVREITTGDSPTRTLIHDPDTWSFLREVEANLEYPPAFLKMLPDEEIVVPTETSVSEDVVKKSSPVNSEPPVQRRDGAAKGMLEDIRESSESSVSPFPSGRKNSARSRDLSSKLQSASPTLPSLGSSRRSSLSKQDSQEGKGKPTSSTESDFTSLKLDGTALSSAKSERSGRR